MCLIRAVSTHVPDAVSPDVIVKMFLHLIEQCIQHADTEHPACSKRQPEHESQVGALITLYLKGETCKNTLRNSAGNSMYFIFTSAVNSPPAEICREREKSLTLNMESTIISIFLRTLIPLMPHTQTTQAACKEHWQVFKCCVCNPSCFWSLRSSQHYAATY